MLLRSALAGILLTALSLAAGAQPDAQTVTIPVTLTDRAGNPSTAPLTADNFRVLEDGREQTIVSVTGGPGPVSIGVVLDPSESLIGTPQRLGERAVEHLAARLTPEDEIALVMLKQKDGFTVPVPWTPGGQFPKIDWTTWHTLPFSDMLNGVRNTLFLMDRAKHPRRAVLAITGMEEVGSSWPLVKYAVTQAQSETAIYSLWLQDLARPVDRSQTPTFASQSGRMVTFDDLLRDGGGRWFSVRSPEEADRGADKFLEELRNQYVIRYRSAKPFDGAARRLKVELKNTRDLKIRHRLGYVAKPPRT